jgi:hypothetical protein
MAGPRKGRRKEAERALKKLGTKEAGQLQPSDAFSASQLVSHTFLQEEIVHADTGSAPTGSPTGAGIPFKRRVHQKETCQACVQVASTLRTSFKFCLDSES